MVDSIHTKVNDARKHIEKLGSNALTRLVAWELTRLSSADALVLADEILQIRIPEATRLPVVDPFICPRHRKRFTLIERSFNGKRTCPNGEQWVIVGDNYEEC
jgi:hypothetical protein